MSQIWEVPCPALVELVSILDVQGETRSLDLYNPEAVRDYIARKKRGARVTELARLDDMYDILKDVFPDEDLQCVLDEMRDIRQDVPNADVLLRAEHKTRALRKVIDQGLLHADSPMLKTLVRAHARSFV